MDKAKIQQLIEEQLKYVGDIQIKLGRLSVNCPPEELMMMTKALDYAVSTLLKLNAILPAEPMEPSEEDIEFDKEFAEMKERHRKGREDFDKRFKERTSIRRSR